MHFFHCLAGSLLSEVILSPKVMMVVMVMMMVKIMIMIIIKSRINQGTIIMMAIMVLI